MARSRCPCNMPVNFARLVFSQSCSLLLVGGQPQVVDHRVDVVLEVGHLAAGLDLDRPRQVALGHRGGHLGDRAHLGGQVRRQQVHVAGQVLPRARRARHVGLAAEAAFHAHFARDRGDLVGEDRERLGHVVDGVGERRDFALRLHEEVLLQVAFRHRGDDLHDAAHLLGEVGRHHVHGVGQVLPGAAHARHLAPGRRACLRCPLRARRA